MTLHCENSKRTGLVIFERQYSTITTGLLARKNGRYTRPIITEFFDVRIEDYMPDATLHSKEPLTYIARLPDILSIGQIGQYIVADANRVEHKVTEQAVQNLLQERNCIILPHDSSSPWWQYSKSPWWEYCICMDTYNGYIKAPKLVRQFDPTPEEIDEQLDKYPENHNKIRVLSPQTINKWKKTGVSEDYISRVERI